MKWIKTFAGLLGVGLLYAAALLLLYTAFVLCVPGEAAAGCKTRTIFYDNETMFGSVVGETCNSFDVDAEDNIRLSSGRYKVVWVESSVDKRAVIRRVYLRPLRWGERVVTR